MAADPYRHIARFYDRIFKAGALGLADVTVGLAAPAAGGAVLDVGCGTGLLLSHCLKLGLRATGVDPSPAMLSVARARLGESAELRQEGGHKLSFPDETFDAVFATMVIHELSPEVRRATLTQMLRVTRRSGVVAIADYHCGDKRSLWGLLQLVVTTAAELAAGGAHFAGFRHFKANGCLPGLLREEPVAILRKKTVAGGNIAVHVLAPGQPKERPVARRTR